MKPAEREVWRNSVVEPAIDPDLPIIDAHHHLWPVSPLPMFDPCGPEAFYDDIAQSGHHVVGTVFVEGHAAYRVNGPDEERSIGETEYANRVAGEVPPLCTGIVAFADLRLGDRVGHLLDAHMVAAEGKLRGIRMVAAVDPDLGEIPGFAGLLGDRAFREGFALLAEHDLTFDAWVVQPQLDEVAALARAFPDQTIVLDHLGGPLGIGRHAPPADAFEPWRIGMTELARCPNVVVKLGGLNMPTTGLAVAADRAPYSSTEMARVIERHMLTAIDLFGPDRCMFESNFPVDRMSTSYGILWNAFKRISANFNNIERQSLFENTAKEVYRLETP